MTTLDITALRKLLSEATPGPWVRDGHNMSTILRCVRERGHPEAQHVCGDFVVVADCRSNWDADAACIVALVNSAPALLSEAASAADLRRENARLREALTDATANLAGAASAYRKYAGRSRTVGRGCPDPFFTTRVSDLVAAVERARAAIAPQEPADV